MTSVGSAGVCTSDPISGTSLPRAAQARNRRFSGRPPANIASRGGGWRVTCDLGVSSGDQGQGSARVAHRSPARRVVVALFRGYGTLRRRSFDDLSAAERERLFCGVTAVFDSTTSVFAPNKRNARGVRLR